MSAKLSIITITYQAEKYLERTIQSMLAQGHRAEIEYIVIDGASKDGTLDLIETYKSQLDQFVSEPDKGIYDAMNKGLQRATGDYVIFMNAGDTFADENTVAQIIASMESNPDVIVGDALFVDEAGKALGLRSEVTPHKIPKHLTWKSFQYGMVICHQSFVAKRIMAPRFDLSFRLSSDIDWEIQCLKLSGKTTQLTIPICRYLTGGASVQNLKRSWQERYLVLKRHFGLWKTLWAHVNIIFRGIQFAIQKGGKYW
ncbi:MAG: putative glycosyltransferase [Bacteroidota bacterium]|jgi:glycosyltransferase involved in cell wall biosynthesis